MKKKKLIDAMTKMFSTELKNIESRIRLYQILRQMADRGRCDQILRSLDFAISSEANMLELGKEIEKAMRS